MPFTFQFILLNIDYFLKERKAVSSRKKTTGAIGFSIWTVVVVTEAGDCLANCFVGEEQKKSLLYETKTCLQQVTDLPLIFDSSQVSKYSSSQDDMSRSCSLVFYSSIVREGCVERK